MTDEKISKTTTTTVPALQRYDGWLASIPASSTTGWRWRKERKVRVINVSGRIYITAEAIAEFINRAQAGEFAKEHKTPSASAA
jgi:hypothetical protein